MFTQALNVDIATISKSAKGRVLFYDADGTCVLGLSELEQIQLQYDGGYIYVVQAGGGTGVFNQGNVPATPMAFNCSFYKFTVVGLTDIDGRPFTALEQPNYDQEAYKAKVREAYEYLVSNIFVGCCNTSASDILWYADFASFPVTGLEDTLYVDKATPAIYVWNGTTYVIVGGGTSGVASVMGYSVDNTDPVNPIVKAIPTAGTDALEPVTGDIEISGLHSVRFWQEVGTILKEISFFDDGLFEFTRTDSAGYSHTFSFGDDGIEYNSNDPNYQEHTSNVAIVDTIKKRIWTKAGTPTTTDDSTQGYVVGSLIQDTTNNILYRCTSNSAGAATWTYANVFDEVIRAGATIPTTATRWMVAGLSGMGTSAIVNMAEKAIHTDFRVVTGSAQPATGTLTVTREITNLTGTVLQTDVLTIAAGSAIGEYVFNTATYDATATAVNMKFVLLNNATSSSAFIQGIQRSYAK